MGSYGLRRAKPFKVYNNKAFHQYSLWKAANRYSRRATTRASHMYMARKKGNYFKSVHNQLGFGKFKLKATKGPLGQRHYGGRKVWKKVNHRGFSYRS